MEVVVAVNGKPVGEHYYLVGIMSPEYDEMTESEQTIQANLLGELDLLINKAVAAGFTIEVKHESVEPLAMRNIRMVACVRKMRNNEREIIKLSPEDEAAFVAELNDPNPPNYALVQAMSKRKAILKRKQYLEYMAAQGA